jgi:hypothetical protein
MYPNSLRTDESIIPKGFPHGEIDPFLPIRLNKTRLGLTILELIIILTISISLLALLITAVQISRDSSKFLEGQNRLRQIGISVQHYCSSNCGKIPKSNVPWEIKPILASASNDEQIRWENIFRKTTHALLLPYAEYEGIYKSIFSELIPPENLANLQQSIKLFENPLDPSQASTQTALPCSYVANAFFFSDKNLLAECQDGLSNTLFFSEHYKHCGRVYFNMFDIHNQDRFHYARSGISSTAPTFADSGYNALHPASFPNADFFPLTKGNPPVSRTSISKTFQNKPTMDQCDSRLLNSSSLKGLQCLLGDGSVTTLNPDVKETIFWALITPNGGEASETN